MIWLLDMRIYIHAYINNLIHRYTLQVKNKILVVLKFSVTRL